MKDKDAVTLVKLLNEAKHATPEELAFKHGQTQRLLRAFSKICDPTLREELVVLVEILDEKPEQGTGRGEMRPLSPRDPERMIETRSQ